MAIKKTPVPISAFATKTVAKPPADEKSYHQFLARMQATAHQLLLSDPLLFTTAVEGLWETYLAAITEPQRQTSNCNTCRDFIERFGGLVMIDDNGLQYSPFWTDNSNVSDALKRKAVSARVTGVFKSSVATLGTPVTGPWQHYSVILPPSCLTPPGLLTPTQKSAELSEHYRILTEALIAFNPTHLATALTFLKAEALADSEKFLSRVQWLIDRQADHKEKDQTKRRNLLWKAVAQAPVGFCTPRAGVVGSLLEDIKEGLPIYTIQRKFAAKLNPLEYQRAQAPATVGNIKAAEAAFEKLCLSAALKRRPAILSEINASWGPPQKAHDQANNTVFGHLYNQPSKDQLISLPTKTMTWVKFRNEVLPEALKLELQAPANGNYSAILTATDPDAPPIMKWDSVDRRNPFSSYVYSGGSPARSWNLSAGSFIEVLALTTQPESWYEQHAHVSQSAFFVLAGAKDTRASGLALFNVNLRSDLHPYRATLEAFSTAGVLDLPPDGPLASGLIAHAGHPWGIVLRVTSKQSVSLFKIDRWD